eukprot:CAMPEP_0194559832 /NCGR_PEP_ID=MMETSP0292-20121207/1239_1 /TAXON_ID=39354 /ORGANISM="Heterosigma akashiwo, Strain CCMP2393" /LENGTH=138 /DNA_ID=CAMNT_0039407859 /DNA_START=28 /DNA_END=444 /DNA_ORIENTATION=+
MNWVVPNVGRHCRKLRPRNGPGAIVTMKHHFTSPSSKSRTFVRDPRKLKSAQNDTEAKTSAIVESKISQSLEPQHDGNLKNQGAPGFLGSLMHYASAGVGMAVAFMVIGSLARIAGLEAAEEEKSKKTYPIIMDTYHQ